MLLMMIARDFAQSFMIFAINDICLKRRYNKSVKNTILEILITTIIIQGIFRLTGGGIQSNIYITIGIFINLSIFYKDREIKKFILTSLYSLVYLLPIVIVLTFNLLIEAEDSIGYKHIIGEEGIKKLIYIVCYMWIFICVKYKNIIIKTYVRLVHMKYGIYVGVISLFIQNILVILFFYKDYMMSKYNIITYNIIFFSYLIAIIIMIIYMIQLKYQRKIILNLNDKLEIKNQELSKIKHDYGAQISYLYGLYLLKRYDELKVQLKRIKESNKNTLSAVEINYSKIRSISDGMTKILDKGVHLVINEYGEIENISLSKEELFKAIEAVIDYIVKDENRENYILMKTYNSFERLNIELKNSKKKLKRNGDVFFEITSPKKYIHANKSIYKDMRIIEEKYNDNLKIICRCGFITGDLKINMIIK